MINTMTPTSSPYHGLFTFPHGVLTLVWSIKVDTPEFSPPWSVYAWHSHGVQTLVRSVQSRCPRVLPYHGLFTFYAPMTFKPRFDLYTVDASKFSLLWFILLQCSYSVRTLVWYIHIRRPWVLPTKVYLLSIPPWCSDLNLVHKMLQAE